jgi:hypothetical protein
MPIIVLHESFRVRTALTHDLHNSVGFVRVKDILALLIPALGGK